MTQPAPAAQPLAAGTPITALDMPPAEENTDNATVFDNSNTSFADGDPPVNQLFIAPTSGKVIVIIGGGIRVASGSGRAQLAISVREDDQNGVNIQPAILKESAMGGSTTETSYAYSSRSIVVEGLEPGRTYIARALHRTTASGAPMDYANRNIIVIPTA